GVLMATLFQWTNGDLYSVCWLIWLFMGFLDVRMRRTDPALLAPPPVVAEPVRAHVWRRPSEPRRDIATS
ncbi:MAG TPA: hypothetical protein VKT18_09270, partial [Acidimicrobiales bacterium]|nr:hypothetical protein [Acidimicrobiales bacterium]